MKKHNHPPLQLPAQALYIAAVSFLLFSKGSSMVSRIPGLSGWIWDAVCSSVNCGRLGISGTSSSTGLPLEQMQAGLSAAHPLGHEGCARQEPLGLHGLL